MSSSFEEVRGVLHEHCDSLLDRQNVVAVGLGRKRTGGEASDQLSVVCSVRRKLPRASLSVRDAVPESLAGVPTDVIETGVVRALQSPVDRHRPAPGGVSVGHRAITAGTLGCVVRRGGERFILSNNHVLANSNDAAEGDAILQPAPHDGGRFPEDQLATLHDFVPIRFPGEDIDCSVAGFAAGAWNRLAGLLGRETRLRAVQVGFPDNLVDAAIARPVEDGDLSEDILGIGKIESLAEAELGMALQKSGRTTGFTTGQIEQVDVTVDVQYGPGRIARFRDQLLAGAMSQGGDSGSAVLDDRKRLVGLLFAGSDNSTILNRIQHVFAALGLGL
ncbi:MAG: hypothetical protein ABFS46_02030 [Myxococcota bacterium]